MSEDLMDKFYDMINKLTNDVNSNLALQNQEFISLRNDIKNLPNNIQIAFDERYVRKDDVEHIVRKERVVSDDRYIKLCNAETELGNVYDKLSEKRFKKANGVLSFIKTAMAVAISVGTTLVIMFRYIGV